ncbi:MAG: serine/threonine-protein kinase [Pirellula sp.]
MNDESLIDDEFSRLLDEYDLAYKRNELDDFWGRNSVASDLKERIERAHEGLRTLETFLVKRTHEETPVVRESNLFGALLNKPVQLDRFEVVREIGRGGFGIVYLANDPALHRQVAIKIPRIESMGTGTLQNRFAKEAEIAASLDHLHIVPVFEVGTTIDGIYIVSLYCPGKNLAQWLLEHPRELNCNQIVELMICIGDAMAYCHERGVLHRDIKPANVLLFPSSFGSLPFTPRLNDFGLAKVLESTMSETASSVMLGTPLYMAPEQACSDGVSVIDMVNKTVDSNRFRTRRGIARLALSPDCRTLAAWGRDEGVYLWNERTGEELFPMMQTRASIDQLQFTADNILQFRKNDHGILSFVIYRCGK